MKSSEVAWDNETLSIASEIVRKHTSIHDAVRAVAEHLHKKVTFDSLSSALRRHGLPPMSSLLASPPEEKLDHVEQRVHKDAKNKLLRDKEDLIKQLREAHARQHFLDAVGPHKGPPVILPKENPGGAREMTAVAALSDAHVEEVVDPVSVAYRNEYNLQIADHRLTRMTNSIIWNVEHQRASGRVVIRELVLWLGGDLMTGYIHPELMENNELSPVETVNWLLPRLRNMIGTILARLKLDRIVIPCSYGNHGRTTDKSRVASGAKNSFEWLLYKILEASFADDKRVVFEITQSPHQYVQVYDFWLHFHHGDSLKYQGGVGGLGIPLLKAIAAWDEVKYAHYHHVAHWHTLRDYGRGLVNGSVIGYAAYSSWIRAAYEPAQQLMYYIDSNRGKTMLTPLWVTELADIKRP